jgi:CRISPR-associated protein Cas1
MQLVIDTKGMLLSVRNQCFWLKHKSTARLISPTRVSSILISTDIHLTTPVLELCSQYELPLVVSIPGKEPITLLYSHQQKTAFLRQAQSRWCKSPSATALVCELLFEKAQQQQHLLLWLSRQRGTNTAELRTAATQINSIQQQFFKHAKSLPHQCRMKLMGLEGGIAQVYWKAIGNSLPESLRFEKRSRQPAADAFNAALNYGYALLEHRMEAAALSCRLDTYMGALHASDYGNKSLVYDLMEPFRPIIDRCLLQLVIDKTLTPQCADAVKNGVSLNKAGKRLVITSINALMEERIKWQHHITATKNHLLQLAARVAKQIEQHAQTTTHA